MPVSRVQLPQILANRILRVDFNVIANCCMICVWFSQPNTFFSIGDFGSVSPGPGAVFAYSRTPLKCCSALPIAPENSSIGFDIKK